MALAPGARLGVYEVIALIGEGGMGQVYRAHDTTLHRDVALKVLPDSFAHDADRLARFQREAKTLASLNHPHIAAIYGLEVSGDMTALVMELVEGEDLSQRLVRGAIPLDDVLPIAKQIADALEAAHEQGIIHRDLKPANVKVRDDGTVKVLDFGLAKAIDPQASSSGVSLSPTITSPAVTMRGVILGTAAYMSPEQAKGRPVDKRTDVWAFGAVLYEMFTGRRAFEGDDVSETLARILMKEPDWSLLPTSVPPAVVTVLRRCLQKDRKQRVRDLGDVSLALEGAFEMAAPQTMASATSAAPRERLAWAVAAVLAVALAGLALVHVRETPTEQPRLHLSVPLPGNTAPAFLALSPDGLSLVMTYRGGLGLRSLTSGEIRLLTGTLAARAPFWSPDSRTIAFYAVDRALKTIAVSGGPPQTLCGEVGQRGDGGTWNRENVIVFATQVGGLKRVTVPGGACTELTKPEPGMRRTDPVFLPDGNHFLYALGGADEARRGVYVASLADPNGRRLLADRSSAVFVPNGPGSNQGQVLFVREQTLMAQAFDAVSLQLSGDPVVVADQVSFTANPSQIAASADMNGTLVYLTNSRPDGQMVWYDRSGSVLGRAGVAGQFRVVSLAPSDNKTVAVQHVDAQGSSLWLHDLERNAQTQLTRLFGPSAPVWSPDGQRLAFGASDGGAQRMYVKNVNGGKEEILLEGAGLVFPSDWSRDGQWLIYTEDNPKTGADIWLLPNPSTTMANRKPVELIRTSDIESQGQISPDGKWLAYCSNESGRNQIYLRPFAGASPVPNRWPVSNASGREPRWGADSKELFYLEEPIAGGGFGRYKIMSVLIGAAPNPAGVPTPLFEVQTATFAPAVNNFLYSPAANGQRFLVNVFATEAEPSLDVILNWGRTASRR